MNIESLAGLATVVLMLGIPIIAIVTSHQRKMAEIIHKNQSGADSQHLAQMYGELQRLQSEVGQLRDRMNQMELAKDDLSQRLATPPMHVRNDSGSGNGI
jgi:hypothetical protein